MSIKLEQNISLGPLTTFKIGGRARLFLRAERENDVAEAMLFAASDGVPVFVLGGGSNILVSDEGFDGLVLQIALKGIAIQGEAVTAKAGEEWDHFVEQCVAEDLAGVECMSGIPGFVGGTPVQNVGAYGQEVADTIEEVRCFDRTSKQIVTLRNADCGFTYRTSIFNTTDRDRYIVLEVKYRLAKGGAPKVSYSDLRQRFQGHSPTLKDVRNAVIEIRRQKSMVIDPSDPNSRSAGSFFKNPIVSRETLIRIEGEVGEVPFFDLGEQAKIPAAWLIERSGFPKGFVHGNAGISSNHTLAMINRGDAKAADIVSLKNLIQEGVEAKFGIVLQPEPVFVGF